MPPFYLIVLSIRVKKQGVYALFVQDSYENGVKMEWKREIFRTY